MSVIFSQSISLLIYRLWGHLSSRRRKQFFGLLILMIFVSFLEIVSIGSAIPFLGILTNPVYFNEDPNIKKIMQIKFAKMKHFHYYAIKHQLKC